MTETPRRKSEKLSFETHTFTPLKDWILVRKSFGNQKSKSGLIKSIKEEKPIEGVVLELGSDCKYGVSKGDRILFHYGAGTTFEDFGEKLSIIKEPDVWAILDKKKKKK